MDVADWLRSLGLGEYETLFLENKIDTEVSADLTDGDLEKLGVPMGHRKRLLKAIASLGATETPAKATSPTPTSSGQDIAERRQLTVMFCDLVGSTAMSARLDPEDLRSVIAAYHRCCASLIDRNGGFVAKYMGDGVLAYFGYPQAHEHDAERAVQAGLAIVEAAPKLVIAADSPLHVRVGIATGVVVVGDLIGSGEAQERGVVGETPNLAARLQATAEPDMVVIAEGTRKLLGNLFELRDLGAKDLKGIPGPTRAWAALRPSSVEGRFEALHSSGFTALVGRGEEFDLLLRRWSKAKGGEGQAVLLSGEAGIGKSRLTAALLEGLAAEPHTRLRYFCSPQHTDSAFYPIIGQMERAAGLARDNTPKAKLDKLDGMLARASTSVENAALFAEMLSLPNDGRYPALDLTPPQRRQRTLEALVSQIEALAREGPVLVIFEDAHWTDPTSLEAFGRMVDRIANLRVLLIVTFRPEFEAPWIGRPHVTALTINRLTRSEIAVLIDLVAGNRRFPANLRQDVVERTDGIPLFVEEMTNAVLEAEGESETRRTLAAIPSPAQAVPASLHASLMARLDRLGPSKEVAQIGATIGREFSHALLAAVASRDESGLCAALDQLIDAGLLFRQGVPPDASYLFKHALVREAAYGTQLRDQRRTLHLRVVRAIEAKFPESAQSRPELLAHHCTEGGLIEQAAKLWGETGGRSLSRSALMEAASQLNRALGQIATLPETPALRGMQIKFQLDLLTVLMHLKGYGAPDVKEAARSAQMLIERAEALGEPPEDSLALFSVLYGFWVVNVASFDGEAARELAAQFLALAEKQRMTGPLMLAHRMMGMTMMSTGDLVEGREHLDRALVLYHPAEHRALATRFGTDAQVAILEWRSRTLWLQGYPDAALRDVDASFSAAREIGQAATLMHALAHSVATLILCRDYPSASIRANELVVLAEQKGSLYWKASGMLWHGCLSVLTGHTSDAIEILARALAEYTSTSATIYTPFVLLHFARARAELGQIRQAIQHIDEAISAVTKTHEKWVEAEIHRISGEIVLLSPEADAVKARACFERAIVVARNQKAKSWELRAVMSMARSWRDQGMPDKARDLLAPIYGWFTEGFDTLDLKEAKALLDALEP